MSDLRLRYLLDDPRGESICLHDVIKAYAASSEKLSKLEYKNTAHALREAKKAVRAAREVANEFYARLKDEVTEDVTLHLSKVDKRIDKKNPEKNKEFLGD